jgi:hypothetical protein
LCLQTWFGVKLRGRYLAFTNTNGNRAANKEQFISGPSCCAPPSPPAAAAPRAHPSAAGTTRLVFSEKAQHRQLLRRKNHIGSWTNPVLT